MRITGRMMLVVSVVTLFSGIASAASAVIDDEDGAPGFVQAGTSWSGTGLGGYNDSISTDSNGDLGTTTSTWSFTSLAVGNYKVYATWVEWAGRSDSVDYTISDGGDVANVNQINAPVNDLQITDDDSANIWFEYLGNAAVTDGALDVVMTKNSTGWMCSDAVAVDLRDPFVIDDGDGAPFFTYAGTFWSGAGDGYGYNDTYSSDSDGDPGTTTSTWSFTSLVDGNYMVYAAWVEWNNRSDSVNYSISDGGGVPSVNQENAPNDRQITDDDSTDIWFEHLSNVAVTDGALDVVMTKNSDGYMSYDAVAVDLIPMGEPLIIDDDNGSPGFVQAGTSWNGPGAGYNNTYSSDSGDPVGTTTSTWSFTSLVVGSYKVYAAWVPNANRSDSVDYTISDGGGVANVNQDNAPANDLQITDGLGTDIWFEHLGNATVTDGTLDIVVTKNLAGYMSSDAVAIVQYLPQGTTIVIR